MGVPPCLPAIRATELFPFSAGDVRQGGTAIQTDIGGDLHPRIGLGLYASEAVISAVGLDAILGQTDSVGDGSVAVALMPEVCYFYSLFVCHDDLQSEGLAFTFHWRLEVDLSGQK